MQKKKKRGFKISVITERQVHKAKAQHWKQLHGEIV